MTAMVGVALAGCTREVGAPSTSAARPGDATVAPTSPATTTVPPRPLGLAEAVTVGGVEVMVLDVDSFDRSPDGVPRVRAVVRSENVGEVERANPAVTLRCAESPLDGDWFRGSTWEPGQLLPPGAVNEGIVLVGFPPKAGSPTYAVASCSDAWLDVEMGGPGEAPVHRRVDVAAEVVAESVRRPRGRILPLPLETR